MAAGALVVAAALAEAALLHGDGLKAFFHRADTEVAVAALDALDVFLILGSAHRNVHTPGMTLQTDDDRRILHPVGQEQVAGHPVLVLTAEGETNLGSTLDLLFVYDLQIGRSIPRRAHSFSRAPTFQFSRSLPG